MEPITDEGDGIDEGAHYSGDPTGAAPKIFPENPLRFSKFDISSTS
jgi:hypothetical protein